MTRPETAPTSAEQGVEAMSDAEIAELTRLLEAYERSTDDVGTTGDEWQSAVLEAAPHILSDHALLKAENAALRARVGVLMQAVEGMLSEWDKFTRYGSPMAKAANERVAFARKALQPAQAGADDGGKS